mgnify:CR=1 FL=1
MSRHVTFVETVFPFAQSIKQLSLSPTSMSIFPITPQFPKYLNPNSWPSPSISSTPQHHEPLDLQSVPDIGTSLSSSSVQQQSSPGHPQLSSSNHPMLTKSKTGNLRPNPRYTINTASIAPPVTEPQSFKEASKS